ncbi:hypothetical protein MATL_G00022500 [Megalops atlanticus]|uniref:Uncharacterized protein n=1 Tax=Megalops atlanticus TaxID=7932 RepID=A0A9D3QDH1_MEGAT|nr:hypothetical protein MATL_G00022500 [Megalops atlanticus]
MQPKIKEEFTKIYQPTSSPALWSRYSFLCSEAKERVSRQQEVIHRKNMASFEINTILQQKELERGQQRGLVGTQIPIMHQDQGIPPNAMAFSVPQCLPAGHLPSNIFVHHTTLKANDLRESPEPYPPIRSLQRKRGRGPCSKVANRKSTDSSASEFKSQWADGRVEDPGEGEGFEERGEQGCKTKRETVQVRAGSRWQLRPGIKRSDTECERDSSGSRGRCAHCPGGTTSSRDITAPEHTCSALPENHLYPTPVPLPRPCCTWAIQDQEMDLTSK